jgi:hypothetical protein
MTEPRRFDEDEVRAIFERATRVEPVRVPSRLAAPSADGGLSLAEIQTIGAEAGIDVGRIAEAAATLTRFGHDPTVKRQMGVAITASATVELPRILSDLEWDHLVVRLREAFGGPGAVRVEGSLRTWTHGHTQVLLEPTPSGARLRMTALDWGAKQWVDGGAAGAISGLGGAGLFGVMAAFGKSAAFLGAPMVLLGGFTALGLGSWAIGRWIANRRLPQLQSRLEALGASALREAETDPDTGRIPPLNS